MGKREVDKVRNENERSGQHEGVVVHSQKKKMWGKKIRKQKKKNNDEVSDGFVKIVGGHRCSRVPHHHISPQLGPHLPRRWAVPFD